LIGVQNVFAAAGIVTALTGIAAIFALRDAAQQAQRGWLIGEPT
jgi:hypothetical protein